MSGCVVTARSRLSGEQLRGWQAETEESALVPSAKSKMSSQTDFSLRLPRVSSRPDKLTATLPDNISPTTTPQTLSITTYFVGQDAAGGR